MARSSPFVIVMDLDGFQQGPNAFTPNCLAMACDRLEFSMEWQFNEAQNSFLTRADWVPIPHAVYLKPQKALTKKK